MIDRVTLIDVAKAAQVHASTASRALNAATRGVVSDKTVEKVLQAAKELGYRPHPLARGLRTDKTLTVGIIVPDLENPLFPPLVRGAEAALGLEGYTLLIGNTDNELEHTEAVISSLMDRRVDGLILATAELGSDVAAAIEGQGVAVVLVNRDADGGSTPAVVGDDEAGIELAVDHLVGLGHTRIGHIAGPSRVSTGAGRAAAFRSHTARHGLAADDQVEESAWFGVEPGDNAASALMGRHPELTALIAANDLLALGALKALQRAGLRTPDDVSVTGYNDMPFVDVLQPPLTTVRVPYREMGGIAARTLLALMRDDGDVAPIVKLEPTLIIRSSTARPR